MPTSPVPPSEKSASGFDVSLKWLTTIGSILASLGAIIAFLAVVLNWEAIYDFFHIVHVNKALRAGVCRKNFPEVSRIEPWTVTFSDADCDPEVRELQLISGSPTKTYICGAARSFWITTQPRQITLYGISPGCATHQTEIEVTYFGYRHR